MPICLPYVTIFCGLSFLPGKALLRHDLSYGVYLIHAPILIALSLIFPGLRIWWVAAAIVFLITLILAYASWIFVEGPALTRKREASNWVHRCIGALMPSRKACDPAQTRAAECKEGAQTENRSIHEALR